MIPKNKRLLQRALVAVAGLIVLCILACGAFFICLPAWISSGVWVTTCPSGDMRQTVALSAYGLRRGQDGHLSVRAMAHYTTGPADADMTTAVRRFSTSLTLVDNTGEETELEALKGWKSDGKGKKTIIRLPEVPDGNYILRARVDSSVTTTTQDLKLPIFAPARVHVISDRPLYEPGNQILFRAVALKASDLSPIAERPGQWVIKDPSGTVVLEERVRADAWGVSAGSFPMDIDAPIGQWTIEWVSGQDRGTTQVTVEPFTLPRFRVDATADQEWYRAGDSPVVRGQVVYSSGAPVANIPVTVIWTASGDWPWPRSWKAGGLPKATRTNAAGRYVLRLPEVPEDLVGTATLNGQISAIDAAGDRVTGSVSLLLSEYGIAVEAVTELENGLVSGFNNRLFLRVTTPTGTPHRNTQIKVKRAWGEPRPITVDTDADGVAALQIDPGEPVTVKLPIMPQRLPPPTPPIRRTGARNLLKNGNLSLADLTALDRWFGPLGQCVPLAATQSATISLAVRVTPSGAVDRVATGDSGIERCMASAVGRQRLSTGGHRLIDLDYAIDASHLPRLTAQVSGLPSLQSDIRSVIDEATSLARSCLSENVKSGELPRTMLWDVRNGDRAIQTRWIPASRSASRIYLPASALSCIQRHLGQLRLEEPSEHDFLGKVVFSAEASPRVKPPSARQHTKLGYEFIVAARGPERKIGKTLVILDVGRVPSVRLRADPVLASPGDVVDVSFIRGPSFTGEPPKHLFMHHERAKPIKAELNEETRSAQFELPADAEGWFSIKHNQAKALVFVRSPTHLSVELQPDRARYAPGDKARISISTLAGDEPVAAAVGLIGVDNSLSQLVSLPGPDAMEGLQPQVKTAKPAFGILDGQALSMGRIQGEHAAAATVLRVTDIPQPEETDRTVSGSIEGRFNPIEDLTDHFYTVLAQLYNETSAWEESAPAGEHITPKRVAQLWDAALAACTERGEVITDAFGRKLRLSWLPDDLLALTDPRMIVSDATRLPEDVENWRAWVREERP